MNKAAASSTAMAVDAGGKRVLQAADDKDDKKPKTTRRRQRARDKGKSRDKPVPAMDQAGADMNSIMIKGLLSLFQRTRFIEATVFVVWLFPADSPLVEAVRAQGAAYAETCRKEGSGHTLGPPHPYMVGGLLDAILAKEAAVGLILAAKVKNLSERWDTMDLIARCDLLPHCKLDKCYDKEKMRLTLCLDRLPTEEGEVLKSCITLLGGERKAGRAPSSAFEDQLEMWLDSLAKVKA